jgi:hypothetical protein
MKIILSNAAAGFTSLSPNSKLKITTERKIMKFKSKNKWAEAAANSKRAAAIKDETDKISWHIARDDVTGEPHGYNGGSIKLFPSNRKSTARIYVEGDPAELVPLALAIESAVNNAPAILPAVTHPITGLSMHEISEENARLTANNAALLEALQNLEDAGQKCFEDILATGSINRTRGQVYREAKEQARAAIKTATGKATP